MNRAVGRVGEGLLRLTQLPHYKDSESFQDFKGFREESPFSLSSASFSFPSCPSPFPPGRVFLHHSCAYVDALRLTPRSLPFSACVRPVLLTPSAGAHSKCPLFSFLLLSLSNLFGTPQLRSDRFGENRLTDACRAVFQKQAAPKSHAVLFCHEPLQPGTRCGELRGGLSSRPPGAESLKHRKLPRRSRPAGGRALRLTDD